MLQLYHLPIVAAGLLLIFFFARYLRLQSIPGPWITSFTDLWRVYHQRGNHFTSKIKDLHEKYGPLVRLGPNSVCISDASAVSTIYTMHGEFKKADSYATMRAYVNGEVRGSFVDIQDEEKVTGIRRALGSTFATKNLLDYENDVDDAVAALLDKLTTADSFDIVVLCRQFQIDFLKKIAFSEPPHILSTDADLTPYNISGRLIHAIKWQGAPYLEHLLYKTRIMNCLRASPTPPLWTRTAVSKLQQRSEEKPKPEGEQQDLLDKYIAASKHYPQILNSDTLLRIISSTISAGYDTTALALLFVIYYLCSYPQVYESLQKEIDTLQAEGKLSNPPAWTEVNKMVYLDAFLKETLRCHSVVTQPLERVVPAGGVMLCGKYLPAGTWVGVSPSAVHLDKSCFGEDAKEYRPERWIEADHDKRVAMEKGYLAFGAGKRNCIGKHIAELELKKTIPAILMNYKIRATDGKSLELTESRLEGQKPVMVSFDARN